MTYVIDLHYIVFYHALAHDTQGKIMDAYVSVMILTSQRKLVNNTASATCLSSIDLAIGG